MIGAAVKAGDEKSTSLAGCSNETPKHSRVTEFCSAEPARKAEVDTLPFSLFPTAVNSATDIPGPFSYVTIVPTVMPFRDQRSLVCLANAVAALRRRPASGISTGITYTTHVVTEGS